MNETGKTSWDWSVILLTVWLTSRLFWSCDPSGFAFDYLWGLIGMTGAACWVFFRKEGLGRITVSDMLVGVFFCLYILSGLLGIIHGEQRAALNCVWSSFFYVLIYILVRQIVVTPERKRILLSSLLCGAVVLSVWAVYQRYVEYPADKAKYQANPAVYLQEVGIDSAEDSPARRSFEDRFFAFEPSASFSLTNSLAVFLTPCFFLLAAAWAKNWNRRAAWALVAAIGALCFAILLTHSRAAMLGIAFALFLGIVYGIARVPNRVKAKWMAAFCFVILATLAGTLILIWKPSVVNSAFLTMGYRLEYWDSTFQIIERNPWLGVGAGNFQNVYSQFMPPTAGESVADPHNFLLEIAALSGIPAALIFWSLLGWLGYRLAQQRDNSNADISTQTNSDNSSTALKTSLTISLLSLAIGYCLGFVAMSNVPGPFIVLLCASGIVPFLIVPGIGQANFSPVTLALALIGLLVALTFSGGIVYTTIAALFWVLTALIVNDVERAESQNLSESESQKPGVVQFQRWITTGGLLVLIALCYLTGFYPTTESARAHAASLSSGAASAESQLSYLELAAEMDPMSYQARFDLAQWHWMQWTRTKNPEFFKACVTWFQEAIERNPQSSVLWREYGIRLYRYGRESGDWSHENDAFAALTRACDLHQADYVARAYLELLNLTSPVLTPGQEEMCRKALNELNAPEKTPEERNALITKTILNDRRLEAQQRALELIQFSDNNKHQNRKIPASLREELIRQVSNGLEKR